MRKLFPAIVLVFSVLALSACAGSGSGGSPAAPTSKPVESNSKPVESASTSAGSTGSTIWKITVAGLGQDAVFTSADVEKIGTVTIKASMKEQDTTGPQEEWTGVPLSKVLKQLGANQYTTVKVESADGATSKEYTPDLVDSEGTILGIAVNGKPLGADKGPVELVVNGKGSKWWIKQVAKITVEK